MRPLELTSSAQEAPAHVDGRGEEAVPLGAAVAAADHDVMGEDHAACRHAAVPRVIGHRAADAADESAWTGTGGGGREKGGGLVTCECLQAAHTPVVTP